MLRIELLIDAHAELGEGPIWDVAEQRLYWIDRSWVEGPFL
jgi:L-arabinonolactonase